MMKLRCFTVALLSIFASAGYATDFTTSRLAEFKHELARIPVADSTGRLRLAREYTNDLKMALSIYTQDSLGSDFPTVEGWADSILSDSEPQWELDWAIARRLEAGNVPVVQSTLRFLDGAHTRRAVNVFAMAMNHAAHRNQPHDTETLRTYLTQRFSKDFPFFLKALENGSRQFRGATYYPFYIYRNPVLIPFLLKQANTDDMYDRVLAVNRLAQIPTDETLAKLEEMAKSDESQIVRERATKKLEFHANRLNACKVAYGESH